jgi:hypothetical protein
MAFISMSSLLFTVLSLSFSAAMWAAMRVPVLPRPALQCSTMGPLGSVLPVIVGSLLKLSINYHSSNGGQRSVADHNFEKTHATRTSSNWVKALVF